MNPKTIFETVQLLIGDWAERYETPSPNCLDVYLLHPEDLAPAVTGLRVKRLGYLVAITGIDPGAESATLEAVYHFAIGGVFINLRVQVPKMTGSLESLRTMIPSSEPYERELSEMFGVQIIGLRIPDHLYLPEDWPGEVYPMRKDVETIQFINSVTPGNYPPSGGG